MKRSTLLMAAIKMSIGIFLLSTYSFAQSGDVTAQVVSITPSNPNSNDTIYVTVRGISDGDPGSLVKRVYLRVHSRVEGAANWYHHAPKLYSGVNQANFDESHTFAIGPFPVGTHEIRGENDTMFDNGVDDHDFQDNDETTIIVSAPDSAPTGTFSMICSIESGGGVLRMNGWADDQDGTLSGVRVVIDGTSTVLWSTTFSERTRYTISNVILPGASCGTYYRLQATDANNTNENVGSRFRVLCPCQ